MAFSEYLAKEVIDWMCGSGFPNAINAVWVTLHTGDPTDQGTANDVTNAIVGGATVSVEQSTAGTDMTAITAAGGGGWESTNTSPLTITASANNSTPLTLTHFGVWDKDVGVPAPATPNFLASGTLTSSVTIQSGDTVQFNANALAIKVI